VTASDNAGARSGHMEDLKPILFELSGEIRDWTGDSRLRMYILMREIAKDLDDPVIAKSSLGILVMILSKGGKNAIDIATPLFKEKVMGLYNNPLFKNERWLPRLLLIFEGYDTGVLEALTKEAIHSWDDDRFKAVSAFLGFDELGGTDARRKLKGFLGHEIAEAGLTHDRTALNRAVDLYHEVR
jgi:hypothetical protein